jgi:hypothetical protein
MEPKIVAPVPSRGKPESSEAAGSLFDEWKKI